MHYKTRAVLIYNPISKKDPRRNRFLFQILA
jgi:hypothetical protein